MQSVRTENEVRLEFSKRRIWKGGRMTNEEAIRVFKGFRFLPREMQAVDMAKSALEKQIPKEPSQLLKHTDYFHWECPICHMSYGMATQKVKYCYNCGQAIKWE